MLLRAALLLGLAAAAAAAEAKKKKNVLLIIVECATHLPQPPPQPLPQRRTPVEAATHSAPARGPPLTPHRGAPARSDLRPEVAYMGETFMHTPNIDAFAKESLVFTRAFCQQVRVASAHPRRPAAPLTVWVA